MQPPPPPPPPPPHPTYHPSSMEDGGHSLERPKSELLTFILSVCHNLTQIFIGGVVVSALILPNINTFSNSYAQHIILCTIGYFVLMAQAILSFSPFGCASNLKYENKRIVHAMMQVLGSIMAIAGSLIRLIDLEFSLNTGHGICGFIAMILTMCSLIGGAVNLICPRLNNKIMKILHSLLGSVTLSVAFVSIIFAFHNYYRFGAGDGNANLAIILSVFALVGILLMAMVRNVKRILNV